MQRKSTQNVSQNSQSQTQSILKSILEAEASLEMRLGSLESNRTLLETMITDHILNYQFQGTVERNKIDRVKGNNAFQQTVEASIYKMSELNQKIIKTKEFYIFCKFLKADDKSLEKDIEKYFEFAKKEGTLTLELQAYLNDPLISDIIFKEYLKCYNVNIFTSDLIRHYFSLSRQGLLRSREHLVFESDRIPQLVLLQKKNIVFKQLYDVNEKYVKLQESLESCYITEIIKLKPKAPQSKEVAESEEAQDDSTKAQKFTNKKEQAFETYNEAIEKKLQNLNGLLAKMSMIGSGLVDNRSHESSLGIQTVLFKEHQKNFSLLTRIDLSNHKKEQIVFKEYKQFLVELLSESKKSSQNLNLEADSFQEIFEAHLRFEQSNRSTEKSVIEQEMEAENEVLGDDQLFGGNLGTKVKSPQGQSHFQFLRQKIIKFETCELLNQIFSSLNLLSFLMEQLNVSPGKEVWYSYSPISKLIENEFAERAVHESSCSGPSAKSPEVQTDAFDNWVVVSGSHKIMYPSAVSNLCELLKYMVLLSSHLAKKNLYTEEVMLQILSLKAEQIYKCSEVLFNIYNTVKSKEVSCYPLLQQYLLLSIQGFLNKELQFVENIDLTSEQHDSFSKMMQEIDAVMWRPWSEEEMNCSKYEFERRCLDDRKELEQQIKSAKVSRFLTFYAEKAKKYDFLSQIVYELDTNYEIKTVLEELLFCQNYHFRSFYFEDSSHFYQTVLYEIIQMRNNIKVDHFYTLPKLHETFGFFTVKALSFGDILNELAVHSTQEIKVEELLLFFKTQLRLKRMVFKGELYWISYKNLIEEGRNRTFNDFLEEHAKNILSLSHEAMGYFLIHIKDFVRMVDLFEQEIERIKLYYIMHRRCDECSPKYRIKNLETQLKFLSFAELSSMCYLMNTHNPVTQILKEIDPTDQLFSDCKMSIQLSGKIRFEDINRNIDKLREKTAFSNSLFLIKMFGFEFDYSDCFERFVEKKPIKMAVLREKHQICKHFDEIIVEDAHTINFTTAFYDKLLLVALFSVKQSLVDAEDKLTIDQIMGNISGFSVSKQRQAMKGLFRADSGATNQPQALLYPLLRVKAFLARIGKFIVGPFEHREDKFAENMCLVARLSFYSQKKIVQKIQSIHHEIIEKEKTNGKKILKELKCLNNKILKHYLDLLKSSIDACGVQSESLVDFGLNDSLISSEDEDQVSTLSKINGRIEAEALLRLRHLTEHQSEEFKKREELSVFNEVRGFKVEVWQREAAPQSLLRAKEKFNKRNERKQMKGVLAPSGSPHKQQYNILTSIQGRVGIEMIRESMSLRRVIARLELEDKQMRDQIAWETSRLEHNVVNRIHAFITESSIDQEQSYINFKHTVNLETIKGMENVIQEQTDLALKTSHQSLNAALTPHQSPSQKPCNVQLPGDSEDNGAIFLTNPTEAFESSESKLEYQNSRLLNSNIDSIFNHMKKIKVFAAWKKIHRSMDFTNQEWVSFNSNVASILHNQENLSIIGKINEKRNSSFKENILCSLLKEENQILSEKIRSVKVENLSRVIKDYRKQILGDSQPKSPSNFSK